MSYTQDGVLEFVQDNDVKFVRLVFCDILGAPKNVAVMAEYLPQVFEKGTGFDASAVDGFMNVAEGDLQLYPDPATLAVLPWRPQNGRVARMYCNVMHPGGEPFAGDGRGMLRAARQKALETGLIVKARCECEFYLFKLGDDGEPTMEPCDDAGYLDVAPQDKCENVRRDICLALEGMGLAPMGSHHEKGPGQNEIWCRATDVLACADDLITYKTVVRTIAAQHGLFASFMPKPLAGKSGSGLHFNLSLHAAPGAAAQRVTQKTFQCFMAGILEHLREMTLFLNPATNSYGRFGSFEIPAHISWANGNRPQLVRVPFGPKDDTRMELRSPDALCNPYYALTLLLCAGLEGVRSGAALPRAVDLEPPGAAGEGWQALLPKNLGEALKAAQDSLFIGRCLPQPILDKIFEIKRYEWERYLHTEDRQRFERAYYFERL